MIIPTAGKSGTSGNPITIRALNDGGVLLDAQHNGYAVTMNTDNHWFVVEGINAKNGLEGVLQFRGTDNVMRRVIGWDGTVGQADSNIIKIRGDRSRAVDCAGWGVNSRKIFDGAQEGNVDTAGFKRCWGEWNGWPNGGSVPVNTLQIGYNTTHQLFENLVMTWDTIGTSSNDNEGVIGAFYNQGGVPNSLGTTRLLGTILYTRTGSTFPGGGQVFMSSNTSNFTVTDMAIVVTPGFPTVWPAYFFSCGNPACTSNVCTNCLFVDSGSPKFVGNNSGWTFPSLREGNSLAAATGGTSAFVHLPGICRRYENGSLTGTPLWPWPMSRRIKLARALAGRPGDVNGQVAAVLGAIPSGCIASADRANVGGRTISGNVTFGPIEVWTGRNNVTSSVHAAGHMNGAITLTLTIEASYDGGSNWQFVTSTKRAGGSVLDDAGNAQPNLYATTKLKPEVGGVMRLVRAVVNMPSSSFVSNGGFIEASN
jgi:hypothetical protein